MQRESAFLIDNGMACVASALISYDYIVLFGEKVCQPAFAFVTPVDPDNCAITHFLFPLFSCSSYEFPEERMSSVRSALEFRMILHSYIEAAARKGH